MKEKAQLVGYADAVGKGIGFLVPLFLYESSNSLFIQRISEDGLIVRFEPIGDVSGRIVDVKRISVTEGDDGVWAFAFSNDDIVSGRGEEFRTLLKARSNDPILEEHPLLSVEVAEFLEMPAKRIKSAQAAFQRLSELSLEAANTWMDLSILTPDLRRALVLAGGEHKSIAKRLVATVRNNKILLRGIEFNSEDSIIEGVKRTVRRVMADLVLLYPVPAGGWVISAMKDSPRDDSFEFEVIIFFQDGGGSYFNDYIRYNQRMRISVYCTDDVGEFFSVLAASNIPAFVVARGRADAEVERIKAEMSDRVTFIHLAYSGRNQIHRNLNEGREFTQVFAPTASFPGVSSEAVNIGVVSQVVSTVLTIQETTRRRGLTGDWLFYRATGGGVDPINDMWAALYDKVLSSGMSLQHAYISGGPESYMNFQRYSSWAQEFLFSEVTVIRDQYMGPPVRHVKSQGSILLSAERRQKEDWFRHTQSIERVLSYREWAPMENQRGGWSLGEGGRGVRFVRPHEGEVGERYWDLRSLLERDIASIDSIAVIENANASGILAHLGKYGEWAVSVRDLCACQGKIGILSILAAQLRRLNSGPMSRGNTHFMGMIIDHVLRHGNGYIEEVSQLGDVIHEDFFGGEVQLSWSRVKQNFDETTVFVRLLVGKSSRYLSSATDLISPFSLKINQAGIFIFRE